MKEYLQTVAAVTAAILVLAAILVGFRALLTYKDVIVQEVTTFMGEVTDHKDVEPEVPVASLVVNCEFDGSNDEYIYDTVGDDNAITRIRQVIEYFYYSDRGDAVETIETSAYCQEDIVSSKTERKRRKMPDNSIASQLIEYNYEYSSERIRRVKTNTSYANDGSIISTDSSETTRNRSTNPGSPL